MADIIPNQSLGRALPLIQNVEDNSPAGSLLRLIAWVITATDATLRDVADNFVSTFEAVALVTEATPYTRNSMVASQITITVDDTGDQVDVIFLDQTFSSVAAQTAWSDLSLAYDASGSDADTVMQNLFHWDFIVTPNGGDITVDFPATAAFRVAQV
jgi:hypothetical protein